MKFVVRAVALALALVCAAAQPTAQTTLLNTIRNSADHTVFSRLLPASSPALDERFGNPTINSTVFAPTDAAFAALIAALGFDAPATPEESIVVLTALRSTLDEAAAANPAVPSFSDLLYFHMFPVRRGLFKSSRGRFFNTGLPGAQLGYSDADQIIDLDTTSNTPITTKNIRHINGFLNIIPEVLLPAPAGVVAALVNPSVVTASPSTSVIPAEASPSAQASEVLPSPTALASIVVPPPTGPGASPTASASVAPSVMTESPATESADPSDAPASPETVAPGDGTDTGSGSGDGDETADASADPSDDEDDGVCFPASAEVTLADGSILRMDQLQAGHAVMHNAEKQSSKVFLFTHRTSAKRTRFVRLTTACGQRLTLTASHYVRDAQGQLVAAGDVTVGETAVRTVSGACVVTKAERVPGVGLYAPHSMHGDLVVDGVVVSGYSKAVHPAVAHALLFPVRWFSKTFGAAEPLGATFYEGADSLLRFLPKGHATVSSV